MTTFAEQVNALRGTANLLEKLQPKLDELLNTPQPNCFVVSAWFAEGDEDHEVLSTTFEQTVATARAQQLLNTGRYTKVEVEEFGDNPNDLPELNVPVSHVVYTNR